MEFIKSWITNITVVIIFAMLMDILIPDNDMKKFAKVIMGLLIILVIVKPFLMIKDISLQFESTMVQAAAYIDGTESQKKNSTAVFQNNTAVDIYKQKLNERVSEIVKANKDMKDKSFTVSVEIENDMSKKDFGNIKSIQVFVENGKNKAVHASSIQPVKINTETVMNKKQDEYKWNNSKLSQDLTADINNSLGLKDTEIKIEIQE